MADPVVVINSAIPQVGIALVAILMFLIMMGLLGFKRSNTISKIAAVASVFFVLYVFLSAAKIFNSPFFSFLNDPDLQFFVVFILGLGLLIRFLSSGEEKDPNKKGKSFLQLLSEDFEDHKKGGGGGTPP